MSQSRSTQWDIGRFVQTLAYFEAIPVVSWVQKMFVGSTPLPPPQPQAGLLFEFTRAASEAFQLWGALDDVVMGGVSASALQQSPEGARFAGYVSTENSGGFASVRTRNFEPPLDLSAYGGLELTVQGDGQRYKFLVRDGDSWDSVAFASGFDTIAGEWQTVRLPFSEMIPVFRAKTLNPAPTLKRDRIRSLQLMLSKFEYDGVLNPHFQPGAFQLLVQSIGVYP